MADKYNLDLSISDGGWNVAVEMRMFSNKFRSVRYETKKGRIVIGCHSAPVETWLNRDKVIRILRNGEAERVKDDDFLGYGYCYNNSTLANGEAAVKALVAYAKKLPKIPKMPTPPKSPKLTYSVPPAKVKKKAAKKK